MLEDSNHIAPKTMRSSVLKGFEKLTPFIALGLAVPTIAFAKDISFLKEPTQEFVEDEKKTKAFMAEQLKIKAKWDELLKKFDTEKEEPDLTEANLKALVAFLKPLDGIPVGLKKQTLVKICRAKKFLNEKKRKIKPTWTKECEIQYQLLILLFNEKVLPNNRGAVK